MEYLNRFYGDSHFAAQLGNREIASIESLNAHFGTLTHGFATGETHSPPPIVAAPIARADSANDGSASHSALQTWSIVVIVLAVVVAVAIAAVLVTVLWMRSRKSSAQRVELSQPLQSAQAE
jgi:hypothetical protein